MVNEVFYRLLQTRQLSLQDSDLQAILSNEETRNQFEGLAEAFECQLGYFSQTLYLIPNSTNEWLGYSKKALKERLLKSNQPVVFYYLYMFIVLVLLNEFYSTNYGQGKTRQYIHLSELMNRTGEYLRQGANQAEGSSIASEVPYEKMLAVYESLKSEISSKEQNTKSKLFDTILKFLEEQQLIQRFELKGSIRPTQRLDDIADYVLRSSQGYHTMKTILGENPDA
ncbi:MAG: hypothetical protein K2H85_06770 [Allobaculum sp.]|nr:hypothetical protein [Allobaculum sp.]